MNATLRSTAIVTCLLVMTSLAIILDSGPAPQPADAPSDSFSAARAFSLVEVISRKPHPIGSTEHAVVRDYLLRKLRDLGLEPEFEKDAVVDGQTAAIVENLHAVIRGTHSSRSVLLVAHYDSVPTSFGASDDGSGVGVILETARALMASPRLRNDIEILLTDGEEVGLLGSQAFVAKTASARKSRIILNFEARGNTGPAVMFETAGNEDAMIRVLLRSVSMPNATSLSSEVYKHMPNDTDFTVLRSVAFCGLNFAFVDGFSHYHTMLDSSSDLDQSSLQQQGLYALGLARHFGDSDSELDGVISNTSPTYFTLLGSHLVVLSTKVERIINCLAILLFLTAVVAAIRSAWATLTGIIVGFFVALIYAITAVVMTSVVWKLICALKPEYRRLSAQFVYGVDAYLVASGLFVIAVGFALYGLVFAKFRSQDQVIGGLMWWCLATVAAALYAPGAAYLFAMPLFCSAIALILLLSCGNASETRVQVVLSVAAIPSLLIYVPVLHQLAAALTISALPILTVGEVISSIALVNHYALPSNARVWKHTFAFTSFAVVAIIVGLSVDKLGSRHASPDHVFYALDAASKRAVWASLDDEPDEWTSQFFSHRAPRDLLSAWFPMWSRGLIIGEAPLVELSPPAVTIVRVQKIVNGRIVSIIVKSVRHAALAYITIDGDVSIVKSWIGTVPFKPHDGKGEPWQLFFYAPPDTGIELTLEIQGYDPVHALIYDCSYELPKFPSLSYETRPAKFTPAPVPISDATVVGNSVVF